MQTVQLKKRAEQLGTQAQEFCAKHEGKINLACNIGAYSLGATILAKGTSFVAVLAGTTLVVIGTVGLVAQGMQYVVASSGERGAGDVKQTLAA